MAHRYGHPVKVRRRADGMPASFRWRDARYPVAEVFETWHLMDRWWEQPAHLRLPVNCCRTLHQQRHEPALARDAHYADARCDRPLPRVLTQTPPRSRSAQLLHRLGAGLL